MSLEIVDKSDEKINKSKWNLDNLPVEVFLHICSFLDAETIINSLYMVCKSIGDIIDDPNVWKRRIERLVKRSYPPIPVDLESYDWQGACIEIEKEHTKWTFGYDQLTHRKWNGPHYAAVDCVLLLKSGTVCVTGSRDRSLATWNLAQPFDNPFWQLKSQAHNGWIWQLVCLGDKVYSGGWDSVVKSWDPDPGLQEISQFRCDTSVLSLVSTADILAAGTFSRAVCLFDPRAGTTPVMTYSIHGRSVLSLATYSNYIISASDDHTLGVWDLRSGNTYQDNIQIEDWKDLCGPYPRCLSISNDILYVGNNKGSLHLFDVSHGLFQYMQTHEINKKDITSICHNLGSIMVGSTDKSVHILTPSSDPQTMRILNPQVGEITSIDYSGTTLAAAGTDCGLAVWMESSVFNAEL